LIDLLTAAFAHLPWPLTVLALAWMYRKPFFALLGRVESASSKYGKVTLGTGRLAERLGRAEAMADALALPQPIAAVRLVTSDTDAHEAAVTEGLKAAARRPQIVIADTWQFLVDSTCQLVGDQSGTRPPPSEVIVAASQYVDLGTLQIMTMLMLIPREDLFGPTASPVKDDAVRYVKVSSRVYQRIAERIRNSQVRAEPRGATTGENK
jgi:hypothetical protein